MVMEECSTYNAKRGQVTIPALPAGGDKHTQMIKECGKEEEEGEGSDRLKGESEMNLIVDLEHFENIVTALEL